MILSCIMNLLEGYFEFEYAKYLSVNMLKSFRRVFKNWKCNPDFFFERQTLRNITIHVCSCIFSDRNSNLHLPHPFVQSNPLKRLSSKIKVLSTVNCPFQTSKSPKVTFSPKDYLKSQNLGVSNPHRLRPTLLSRVTPFNYHSHRLIAIRLPKLL